MRGKVGQYGGENVLNKLVSLMVNQRREKVRKEWEEERKEEKGKHTVVDFKSHYNKIKRSKMDISNIYLNKSVLKYLHLRRS